jgi:superfamily I DNA/RNA helicase
VAAEHERIAQSIGPGRSMLCGAAGSGKTMAICARARHLRERHPAWRILVLCFNTSLATLLRRALPADPQTEVAAFHDWTQARLEASGVIIPPPPGRGTQWDRYWTQDMARLLLAAFREQRIAAGAYQAILIDEGQDFVADWYRALVQALDPATGELLVALDPAQNIYGREVAWGDLGLGGAARTWLLEVNHRNSPPIAAAACRLIQTLDGDASVRRARPAPADAALAGGSAPEVHRCASFESSRADALAWIRERRARGVPARDLLVLGLSRLDMITVNAWLNSKGVDAWLPAVTPYADGVRVSTIHAAKGLEADGVLLLDAHHLQTRADAEARRLLYIAMTRARHDLAISYFRDVPLMAELTAACAIA